MVSLLISRLGERIFGMQPEAVADELRQCGYLSETAMTEFDAVRAVLGSVEDSWPITPAPGREKWRDMQDALEARGFLSPAGQRAAREYVPRGASPGSAG